MHLRVFCGEPRCRAFVIDVLLDAAPTWPLRCPRCQTMGRPAPPLEASERALRCEVGDDWRELEQIWLDEPARRPAASEGGRLAGRLRERILGWTPRDTEPPSPAPVDGEALLAAQREQLEHALSEHLPRGALDATQWAATMLVGAHLAVGAAGGTVAPVRLWGRLLACGFPVSAAHAIDAPEALWWAHRHWSSPGSLDLWDLRPKVDLPTARRPLADPEAWLNAWALAVVGADRRSLLWLSLAGPFRGDPRFDTAWGEACALVQDVVLRGEHPRILPIRARWTQTQWSRLEGAPAARETVTAVAAVALRDEALLAASLAPAFALDRDVRTSRGRHVPRLVRAAAWARLARDAGMKAPVPPWLEALAEGPDDTLPPTAEERRDLALEGRQRLAPSPRPVAPSATVVELDPVDRELLAAVRAAPKDDGPRLVYADRVAERDPARGELITVQCALLTATGTRRVQLARRAQSLLRAHRTRWCAPYPGLRPEVPFERGFMKAVSARALPFLEGAGALFDRELVSSLELVDTPADVLHRLAAAPWLPRLEGLTLEDPMLDEEGTVALLAAVGPLRALRLRAAAVPWLLRALPTGLPGATLETLRLGPATAGQVAALAPLEALRALSLDVAGPDEIRAALGDESSLDALTFTPAPGAYWSTVGNLTAWDRLRRLHLRGGHGRPLLAALAATTAHALEELGLQGEVAPLDVLLQRPWPQLHRLHITGPVTGRGAALVEACPTLRDLEVQDAYFELHDLEALGRAESPLAQLAFSHAHGGVRVAHALAAGPAFEHLETLRLYPDLGDDGVDALTARPWPRLETLTLEGRSMSHRGLQKLATTDAFPSLVYLRIFGCGGFRRAEAALRERYGGGAELPRR